LLRILREENHRAGAKRGFPIAAAPHPDESPEALIRQTMEYLARNRADLAAGYGLDHDGWDHEGDPMEARGETTRNVAIWSSN